MNSIQRWMFGFLTVLLPATGNLAADGGARERAFVQALEIFDSARSPEDYRAAAKLLESIVADGFQNGAVYYNLGNAYFRAAEYGRAILSYRKALPYRPRDAYLKANLQQALAAAPGNLGEPPRPWWKHVLFWSDWLAYPTKVAIAFVALSLLPLIALGAVFIRLPMVYYWLTIPLAIIALAFVADIGLHFDGVTRANRAVIVGETIARKGTGDSYEAAFDQPLKDGAEFQILNQTAEWTFGHFEGIGDGWVLNRYVAK